jgi:hypothetical protein
MTTITHSSRPADAVAQDFLTSLMQRVRSFGSLLRMPAPGVPEATAELLRLAAAYESSQPSYAADLRAAASMAERDLH